MGTLLCPAIFFTVWSRWTVFPWLGLLDFLGATEAVIKPLVFSILALCACVAVVFIRLDLQGKVSRRSRIIRHVYSVVVCLIVLTSAVRSEAKRIKGWSADGAVMSIASQIYPDLKDALVLRVDSIDDVPMWTRGPNIHYSVLFENEPVCRLEVCRKYWSYWTCGKYETLK